MLGFSSRLNDINRVEVEVIDGWSRYRLVSRVSRRRGSQRGKKTPHARLEDLLGRVSSINCGQLITRWVKKKEHGYFNLKNVKVCCMCAQL
jgi:hypothetical protein